MTVFTEKQTTTLVSVNFHGKELSTFPFKFSYLRFS
jgi:hypothetical protein